MSLSIAIVGAGIGGFCAAIALCRLGHRVDVFEQAAELGRVGADVNLTPNAVAVLDRLGCGDALRERAARPAFRISRDGVSGEELSRLPMSDAAEQKYGAPQLAIHRADLLDTLRSQLSPECLHLGCRVDDVHQRAPRAIIALNGSEQREFDLIIGADGVHSIVRRALFGADEPQFTGLVSYRSVFRTADAGDILDPQSFTKWWGTNPAEQIVTFPLSRGTETFVFATTAEAQWTDEGWTIPGDIEALRAAYEHFHPSARALLAACTDVTASALHVREPMPQWSNGSITLLGDAAHPMVPFMAQGACMSIEDAAVLARCLDGVSAGQQQRALRRYEQTRLQRTATVQRMSLENEWMKKPGNADWLYGYHAWTTDLASADA